MPANVETMMYVREKPWHGLGTCVEEAPTSADALHLAGLDWEVKQRNIQVCGGAKIDKFKANIRSTDGTVLGVVSDRYRIVQNVDAFAFTDQLIGGEVRYETAGSLQNGKKIWLLARLPETEICEDKIEPYVCFTNSHDGLGSVRVCMTPIRVVCNNTLNVALNNAQRSWSVQHVGDINGKLREARTCLEMANDYMDRLSEYADHMANATVTDEQVQEILNEMFPVTKDASTRMKNSAQKAKDEFMICYLRPDIAKFLNTAWGMVNAMSDMVSHSNPRRMTSTYQENNWGRIMNGHVMVDKMVSLVGRKSGVK